MKYGVSPRDDPTLYRQRQCVAYRQNNPVGYLLNQARYRAKKAGQPFDVTIADLEIPTHCPVFGIPLEFTPGGRTDGSYSLDRWDNAKGYVKGNVKVISWRANQYKGDLTIEEVANLLAYMKGNQNAL